MTAREPPQERSTEQQAGVTDHSASKTTGGLARAVEEMDEEEETGSTDNNEVEVTDAAAVDATHQASTTTTGPGQPSPEGVQEVPSTARTVSTTARQEPTGTAGATAATANSAQSPRAESVDATPAVADEPEIEITEGEAKIIPFVLGLAGFFFTSGDLSYGLLMGAVLMIVVVAGEFVVRLGGEFLEKVDQQL